MVFAESQLLLWELTSSGHMTLENSNLYFHYMTVS